MRARWAVTLVALSAAACHRPFPVKPAGACSPDPGAGCLEAGGAAGALVIRNLSKANVCHVHLRVSSGDDWTEPVDDNTAIGSGFAFDLHVKPATWDVKVSDCAGNVLVERLRVPLAEAGAALTVPAE